MIEGIRIVYFQQIEIVNVASFIFSKLKLNNLEIAEEILYFYYQNVLTFTHLAG